ncbi:hypothetical protein ACE6H2_006637 [Prunus campanulata]
MPQRGNLCVAEWGYKCWAFEAGRWREGMRRKKHRRKKKKSVSFGGGGGKQQLLLCCFWLEVVREKNEKLSKMVDFYSKDMQKQLEALENPGKCKRDHERSSREKCVIFGGSSEP